MILPIQLPQFAPEHWRSLEKQLKAIACKEKLQLEPRDRLVNNVLSTVQHSARSKRWDEVFKMLCDRGIITLEPQKVALQATLLQLLVAQKMAHVLAIPKEEKSKVAKFNKPRKAKADTNPLLYFCAIKFIFAWIAGIVEEYKLTPIYFQLTYKNEHGFYKLLNSKVKIGGTVRAMLMIFNKDYKKRKVKGLSTLAKSKVLTQAFDKILTDKWQDVSSLHEKFCKVSPMPMERSRFDDRLEYRAKKGEIFKHKPAGSNCAFYSSNPDASSFENEWMDLNRAYAIAASNGYTAAINTFRCKAGKKDMTKQGILRYFRRYGLEYRFEVPEDENRLFKWRLVN